MAVAVFGCTNTIVATDYWPQYTFGDNSTPTSTRITEIIEKVAAEVNGYIVAVGGTPGDIDDTEEPISWHWLQHTVGLGAAAAVGRAMTGGDPELTKEYQRQYEKRLAELRKNPETALADHYDDITDPSGDVRSHARDLNLTDTGDADDEYTPTFRMGDKL